MALLILLSITIKVKAESPIAAPRLDWSHALKVQSFAEGCIKAGKVEGQEAQALPVSDAVGVKVTIRWLGLQIGSGEKVLDVAAPPGAPPVTEAADLMALARQATATALREADLTLNDARRRAAVLRGESTAPQIPAPDADEKKTPPPPADKANRLSLTMPSIARSLTVDIQIARTPTPIIMAREAAPDAIYTKWAPGYHGLVMTRVEADGKHRSASVWPASALAANTSPHGQLVQLLTDLGYAIKDWQTIGRHGGPGGGNAAVPPARAAPAPGNAAGGAKHPALARFEVFHLTRSSPDQPVAQLIRGNVVLPAKAVSDQTIEAMAQRLAGQIVHRRRSGDNLLSGTYLPSQDRFDPQIAPLPDIALAVYALARRARFLAQYNPSNPQARQVNDTLSAVTRQLIQQVLRGRDEGDNPAVGSLLVMTLAAAPNLGDLKEVRDALHKRTLGLRNDNGSFRVAADKDAGQASMPVQAIHLAAMAAVYEQTRDPQLKAMIDGSRDFLWTDPSHVRGLLDVMVWLGPVETIMHKHDKAAPPGAPGARGASAAPAAPGRVTGIAVLAQALRDKQIKSAPDRPELGPADVVGGIDLNRVSPDAPPNPDWRTAQHLTFLADALTRRDVVGDADRLSWLIDCGLAARFVAQLMFDEPACYYVRSHDDCLGGIRLALWDNRTGVVPTAAALIAATTLQETLATINLK
ncbi:MAG: hypothetical protein WEC36_03940 [Phycisphaeraceae bacterium]